MQSLLTTPLHPAHLALNAKMMAFGGYDMPLRYTGDTAEHLAVREGVGMFDVSHMGEFWVKGPRALGFLQRLTTNDVSGLVVGKAQYSCMLTPDGGIVDDLIVYHTAPETYLVVVNAANIAGDWAWFNHVNAEVGAELEDRSADTALIALAGPKALETLQRLANGPVGDLPYYSLGCFAVAGIEDTLVATTGYTGERGFELYVPAGQALKLWNALLEAGVTPCGLGARDTLRLEMGYMLYGNDIDATTNPLEAGLGWVVKLKKGDFIGSDATRELKEAGLNRRLTGFVCADRGIPRRGMHLLHQGAEVGLVTSGSFSPSLKQGIGLAYVPAALAAEGTLLHLQVREQLVEVRVTKPPFVKGTSLHRWQAQPNT